MLNKHHDEHNFITFFNIVKTFDKVPFFWIFCDRKFEKLLIFSFSYKSISLKRNGTIGAHEREHIKPPIRVVQTLNCIFLVLFL